MIDSPLGIDQRGAVRKSGQFIDIGSVEAFPFSSLTLLDVDNAGNGDGIADALEISIFGDTLTANATSDSDGDGSLDKDEIASMTNPLDPNDYFRILSFAPASGFDAVTNPVFDISIQTFPGLDYEIQSNEALDFSGSPENLSLGVADQFIETMQVI